MSLLLDLPDDLVLNYVLLFIGDVKEMLVLREVCKAFNEKIELLILAIIELDLIKSEMIEKNELFKDNVKTISELNDIALMQKFRLRNLAYYEEINDFDYFIGKGLMALCRKTLDGTDWENVDYFLKHTMSVELNEIFKFECPKEIVKEANQMCIRALEIPMNITDKERRLLNWFTAGIKMYDIYFSMEPNYEVVKKMKIEYDFYMKRVKQISHYFGMLEV